MNTSEYVNRNDIGNYSKNISDRLDRYDDDKDITSFVSFMKCFQSSMDKNEEDVEYVPKPDGDYGVDLGIKKKGVLGFTFDLEMMVPWNKDWPHHYQHVSFLDRKMKFLKEPTPFIMVWINKQRNKFICADKETILKYPTKECNVKGKIDKKKCLPFHDCRLYAYNTTLTEREKRIFPHHSEL
tara:strand:+ start:59 stop:607 length:549 start_codon:yes stop_codon:yes gene_type:complete